MACSAPCLASFCFHTLQLSSARTRNETAALHLGYSHEEKPAKKRVKRPASPAKKLLVWVPPQSRSVHFFLAVLLFSLFFFFFMKTFQYNMLTMPDHNFLLVVCVRACVRVCRTKHLLPMDVKLSVKCLL